MNGGRETLNESKDGEQLGTVKEVKKNKMRIRGVRRDEGTYCPTPFLSQIVVL